MSQATADRNLLFGILALQLDFITRDQLVAAMQAWVFDKAQTLGQILRKQGALAIDTSALIEALVQKHLAQHGNDIEKSLAAVSSVGSVREELKQVADPDVQASLFRMPVRRPEAADPFATAAPSVGQASSSGLRFRILRPHARGGLGEVLVARDEELHREVALKQIQARHADDRESQARFLLEAEITGGLEHPGIVPVYGLGQYGDGRPFYAMRFIRGASLKEAIEWFHAADKPGRDPGERSLELRGLLGRFVDVCNAIAYAHSRGVLHRDLKPGNVMLGKYGETLVVDWGLAKPLEGPPSKEVEPGEGALTPSSASLASHTLMGSAMGTPQYMSPEQAAGRFDIVGPPSDVYSLGATLYNLLTGHPPVQEADVGTVLQKVQKGDFPSPRQIQPKVPLPLDAICLKAMALAPGDRYASAQALGQDIEHWLADEPVSAWREPWTVTTRRWLGRHRTLVTGVATAVLVATVGLAVAAVLLRSAYESEREAKQLAEDREAQVRKEKEQTEKQRTMAEHNFQLAKQAVDSYHTKVSENRLLNEPGMQPLRQELLEEASKFYKQFVQERGQEPALRGELGKALYRLAQITGEIDSEVKALALYLEAQKIFKALVAADATALDRQSDLASCCYQLGRLYYKADRLGQADAAFKEALALWQPLVAAHPENDSYRDDQARSQRLLGGVYEKTRRLDQAEALYKTALGTWTALALASPKVAEYRRDLAVTQANLAMVASAQARKKTAEDAFGQAVTIQEQLVRDFPHISRYQNDLARSHFNLGDLLVQFGETSKAGPSYVEAARLWKELVGKHPAVTDFNIRLAESYTALAGVYSADGQAAQAEKVCKEAIEIKQKLALAQKQVSSYQDDLARGHFQLGNVYRAGGKAPQAEAAYKDALRILEKLTADLPAVPQYQVSLAKTWNNLGLLHSEQREQAKAEEVFRKALATWTNLTRDQPGNVEYALGLSATAYNLGNLQRNLGNAVVALDWYAQAIRAVEALGPQNRTENNAVKAALRNTHWKRAQALAAVGRHAEALQDWHVALELSGQADRVWFELYHAAALARAGEHVQATAEAAAVAPKTGKNGEMLYQLICVYALATGAAAADIKRTPDERQALAEQYAARALELLGMARANGYFKNQPNLQRLRNDNDLDPLRPRADFRKFLDEVEQKGKVSG